MTGVWEERWSKERENYVYLSPFNDCCIQLAATRKKCLCYNVKKSKAQIYECIIILIIMPSILKQLQGENLLMEKLNQNVYSD